MKLTILALLLSFFPLFAFAEALSVIEFRHRAPESGQFDLVGYVVHKSICPPCGKDELCKPCMDNNVLIGEGREVLQQYPSGGNYVVVFTEDPTALILGKRYILTVEVLEKTTTPYGRDVALKNAVLNP